MFQKPVGPCAVGHCSHTPCVPGQCGPQRRLQYKWKGGLKLLVWWYGVKRLSLTPPGPNDMVCLCQAANAFGCRRTVSSNENTSDAQGGHGEQIRVKYKCKELRSSNATRESLSSFFFFLIAVVLFWLHHDSFPKRTKNFLLPGNCSPTWSCFSFQNAYFTASLYCLTLHRLFSTRWCLNISWLHSPAAVAVWEQWWFVVRRAQLRALETEAPSAGPSVALLAVPYHW